MHSRLPILAVVIVWLSAAHAQNVHHIYTPFFNVASSNRSDNTLTAIPFSCDINQIRDDDWYWQTNADILIQALLNLFTNRPGDLVGPILQGRAGYAFLQKNPDNKAGLALELGIRDNLYPGIGLTWFCMYQKHGSMFIAMPQVTLGTFSPDFVDLESDFYISSEVDLTLKLAKKFGVAVKPYVYKSFGSMEQLVIGFRIGVSIFNSPDA